MPGDHVHADATPIATGDEARPKAIRKTSVVSFCLRPDEMTAVTRAIKDGKHASIGIFARAATLDVAMHRVTSAQDLRRYVGKLGQIGGRIETAVQHVSGGGHAEAEKELLMVTREMRALMRAMAQRLS